MKTLQTGPMTTLKQRAARFGLGLGLAATLALSAVMPALAADPGLTITGTPVSSTVGTLGYAVDAGTSGATASISLNGLAHSVAITVPVHAVDHSGNDAGWNTTFSLASFKTSTNVPLGEGALGVTPATSAVCDTSGAPAQVCSGGNVAVTNRVAPTTYTTDGSAVKMFTTDATTTHVAGVGMGQYDYTTTLTLAVPSTAKAGSYSSTMVVSTVTTP